MKRIVIALLLLLCIFQTAGGVILRGTFLDSNGDPVPDVMVLVDCRENYFFTDKDGVVLAYVEPGHADCAIAGAREGFMVRYVLATIPESADTVDFKATLFREGEPEPVVPFSDQSRFANIESCSGLADVNCSGADGATVALSFDDSDQGSCIFTLSPDEKVLLGSTGYDMENAEKITFLARSQSGKMDVRFFSLIEDCDSPVGTYPSIDRTLSTEFSRIEIDLTRWNRLNIRSIWGCSIGNTGKTLPQVIEVRDLRIITADPMTISNSSSDSR